MVIRRGLPAKSVEETSDWISTSSGRVPLIVADDDAAGLVARPLLEEEGRGVGDGLQPGRGHLEDGQLRDRAEAVLQGPQDPVAVVPLALEEQDDVDHVLERLGPGQRAVLGDVADEEGGDAVALGVAEDLVGDLADLADRARAGGQLGGEDRLDRIDDQDLRPRAARPGPGCAPGSVSARRKSRPSPDAQPVAPELDLLQRFLARDVEDGRRPGRRNRGTPGGGGSTCRCPGSPPIEDQRAEDDARRRGPC